MTKYKSGRWSRADEADEFMLEKMRGQRPYHIINTNVVLVDATERRYRDRGGDSFILSPVYCGSAATGWWHTESFLKGKGMQGTRGMTLATAMAISGAAVNPNTGPAGRGAMRSRLVSTLMSLLNLRLGYWIRGKRYLAGRPNLLWPGIKALLGQGFREDAHFLELTDGGHFDNTGLYELLRRKVRLIVLSDGSGDPNFHFGDLANVTERARVDFGAKIRFRKDLGLDGLLPGSGSMGGDAAAEAMAEKFALAARGYALADITYSDDSDDSKGTLLYIKSTLTAGLPPDVYGYRADNGAFPDQSTGDQFFDERQFEAYRELGYQLTKKALADDVVKKAWR